MLHFEPSLHVLSLRSDVISSINISPCLRTQLGEKQAAKALTQHEAEADSLVYLCTFTGALWCLLNRERLFIKLMMLVRKLKTSRARKVHTRPLRTCIKTAFWCLLQDVCTGSRFTVEGELCVVSSSSPFKRLEGNRDEEEKVPASHPPPRGLYRENRGKTLQKKRRPPRTTIGPEA